MKKIILLFVLGVVIILTACGTIYQSHPVGIGPEYSELKKSPCACLKLDLVPQLPRYL